jgi:hypothetical protein
MIALMMEAASTSETSVNFYQITRRNNPQDSHLNDLTLIVISITFFKESLFVLYGNSTVEQNELK